jgi:hypothetical protein
MRLQPTVAGDVDGENGWRQAGRYRAGGEDLLEEEYDNVVCHGPYPIN